MSHITQDAARRLVDKLGAAAPHPPIAVDSPQVPDEGVAHHGPPVLTEREANICLAMSKWIRIAQKRYGSAWLPGYPDVVKSRLFWRLRSGKEALAHRPPTAYSCPWYELIDEPERAHWAYDMGEWEGCVYFAQCRYDEVLERSKDGKPSVVRFGPYVFSCWFDKSSHNESVMGWWLQLKEVRK